jgi:hypothetical protein
MASRELDECNEAYNDMVNRRLWREANGNVMRIKRQAYRELVRTHDLAGDGLTRPRKRRVA